MVTQKVEKLVERNMAIANKVHSILKDKNIKLGKFAHIMGKNPTEVSKWLSGTHNLTIKIIVKMETALDVDINIESVFSTQVCLPRTYTRG